METRITIRLEGDREEFAPGETLHGTVAWSDAPSDSDGSAELTILWYTEGKGDQDSEIVHFAEIPLDERRERPFEAELPLLPLTYHGELLKIHWVVRVRVQGLKCTVFEMPFVLRAGAAVLATVS